MTDLLYCFSIVFSAFTLIIIVTVCNVQLGVGVFNGVSLSTAKNNSYFTADDLGYLNIELHCIGAMGEGEWLAPNGSVIDFSNNVFNVEDLHGSAILVQKNVTVVEIDGSGVGSAVGSGSGLESSTIPLSLLPFNDSSLEGYYQCIAPDENQNDEAVRIGFFLNGRGKATNILFLFIFFIFIFFLYYQLLPL